MIPNKDHIQFWIELEHGDLQYRFSVIYRNDEQSEYFEVKAGTRQLLIASNRPALRKQRYYGIPAFYVVEGGISKPGLLPKVFEALDEYIEDNLH